MTEPKPDRPRMYGGHLEPSRLPWSWAEHRPTTSRSYWIATTRSDGRPTALARCIYRADTQLLLTDRPPCGADESPNGASTR